ncbi:MAG TPA: NAD(P)/FAD-dependent oxidoreductase [Egibacteraceae bacterium]|jgi:2-polyprenyl-6-methoxyphenol hydroxylase-like FAD-dependent oxidoreductase|nr:NAD(P)/FAD-dependent oxidoreductase [Egibacteraceae bacterium]
MNSDYDAIVVGARCAGSPTAMLLAQHGYHVLVVDRATFPSDTVSTLVIHAPGVAALQRWGLLDAVRTTGCPPLERYTFDFGPVVITGTQHPCDGISTAYAPRRTVLDKILLDAAAQAGADVREGFTIEDTLVEDGAVVGIRGHGRDGRPLTERARVVIGADGRGSVVARSVGVQRYHQKPVLQLAFYTYWSGLPVDGLVTIIRGDRALAAIPTNDDLTLVLVGCPHAQVGDFRRDVESSYQAALNRAPEFARRVRAATREERIIAGGVPNFFRKPFGPGWVLVGDAGYTKDPVTAQGITDAFCGAEQCVTALDDVFQGRRSFEEAMGEYQQRRDLYALPNYELTTQLATLEPPPPELQQLLGAIQGKQDAMDAFLSVIAGTLSPPAFFDPNNVAKLLGAAA